MLNIFILLHRHILTLLLSLKSVRIIEYKMICCMIILTCVELYTTLGIFVLAGNLGLTTHENKLEFSMNRPGAEHSWFFFIDIQDKPVKLYLTRFYVQASYTLFGIGRQRCGKQHLVVLVKKSEVEKIRQHPLTLVRGKNPAPRWAPERK